MLEPIIVAAGSLARKGLSDMEGTMISAANEETILQLRKLKLGWHQAPRGK